MPTATTATLADYDHAVAAVRRWWLAGLAAVLLALPGATAHAAAPAPAPVPSANPCASTVANAQFGANTNRLGIIDLHFFNAGGAPVSYYECLRGRAHPLGVRSLVSGTITSLWGATFWRCERRTREFVATTTLADGSFVRGVSSTHTPSCARRFEIEAPGRVARGQLARLRLVDHWGTGGIATRLCITPPGERAGCRTVRFAKAARLATRRLRPQVRGGWRVELRVGTYRVATIVSVGVRAAAPTPPPTVLATGDSTMQSLDSYIADELGDDATVIPDVFPGYAISRGNGWRTLATGHVAQHKAPTVVMSIGAAEGFAMRGPDGAVSECCDEPWVAEYARRVGEMMRTYRRGGRARVFWLTIPAPNDPARAPIFAAVNTAVLRAAGGLRGVRVLRMDLLFTPDGYRDIIRYRGRDVRVREPDGIHLNVSGAAIAAREVVRAIRER